MDLRSEWPEANLSLEYRNSEMAYKILRVLYRKESNSEDFEGLYSKEIAEEIDHRQKSISNQLSKMEKGGLVQRSKRDKAQYYKLDLEGLVNLLKDEFTRLSSLAFDTLQNLSENIRESDTIGELENQAAIDEAFDQDYEFDSEATSLIESYVNAYFLYFENSTLQKMILDDFLRFIHCYSYFKTDKEDLDTASKAIGAFNILDPMFMFTSLVIAGHQSRT